MRVYMLPTPSQALTDTTNSIHQIVLKLQQHLPNYGVELVEKRNEADLIVAHAGQTDGVWGCDVAHTHGLYPTAEHPKIDWHWAANRAVLNNIQYAKRVTVPSQWVADILRRDLHLDPEVIGWAIDPAEWSPAEHQGYVLWNKTRADGVCDPAPMLELARRANRQLFLTTFGEGTPNVKAVGRQPFERMKELIRQAQVYLATTKETFGIGTLEAMACGVPVLGFAWGATAELVEHGVTGYLVKPGDIEGLLTGLEYCIKHCDVLGSNARKVAQQYTWNKVAQQFAELYRQVKHEIDHPSEIKVSVVIPCYNYAQYVEQAIKSVFAQQTTFKYEVIIVNDGSTDESAARVQRLMPKLRGLYLISQPNSGVAAARNAGIKAAHGEYIVCLDADDQLGSMHFLQVLADALDDDPMLGIAYTGLKLLNAEGTQAQDSDWPGEYDFEQQLQGHNQVPTCCMFRKAAWQQAGGYRGRYTPAEDAELWLRIGSLGYRGKQVTAETWFVYRLHDKSLSTAIRTGERAEPEWRMDKGWVRSNWRPTACDGRPPGYSWPVRNYDNPAVSIVIPVSSYHINIVRDALDSIEAQTEPNWEVIVVNDSSKPLNLGLAYSWVKVIDTSGNCGAAYARNRGIEAAKANLIAFLDADDVFDPHFIEKTLRHYQRTGRYVYTDWVSLTKDGQVEVHTTPEYNPNDLFRRTSTHSINVLLPRQWCLQVGMFDESMQTWEDADFFLKLAKAGLCGSRLPEPLMIYRYGTGKLRERAEGIKEALKALIRDRYREYIEGGKMCGCLSPNETAGYSKAPQGDALRIEYRGPRGTHQVIGAATKKNYGRRSYGDVFYVEKADITADSEAFVVLAEPQPVDVVVEPPAPELMQ